MNGCTCFRRKPRQITIVLLGVDNAGKSTLLATFQKDINAFITPTVGFSSETIRESGHTVRIFDLGGCENFRGIWGRYFAEVHGALFVVDGSDKKALSTSAKSAINGALEDPRLKGKPTVLFVNKQDTPGCLDPQSAAITLSVPPSMPVFGCVAKTERIETIDPRLRQGLQCLLEKIDSQWESLCAKITVLVEEQHKKDEAEKIERARYLEQLRAEREGREREKEEREKQKKEEQQQQPEIDHTRKGKEKETTNTNSEEIVIPSSMQTKETPVRWIAEAPIEEQTNSGDGETTNRSISFPTSVSEIQSQRESQNSLEFISPRGIPPPLAASPALPELIPGAIPNNSSENLIRVSTPPRRLAPLVRKNSLGPTQPGVVTPKPVNT